MDPHPNWGPQLTEAPQRRAQPFSAFLIIGVRCSFQVCRGVPPTSQLLWWGSGVLLRLRPSARSGGTLNQAATPPLLPTHPPSSSPSPPTVAPFAPLCPSPVIFGFPLRAGFPITPPHNSSPPTPPLLSLSPPCPRHLQLRFRPSGHILCIIFQF